MINDPQSTAAALYDGGWRADDREELGAEFNLDENDLNEICKLLKDFDENLFSRE